MNTTTLDVNWGAAVKARRGKGHRGAQTSGAKIAIYKMKDGRSQACLTIFEDAMKQWRWCIGDFLEFVPAKIEGEDCIAVRRVVSGGWRISPANSEKGKSVKCQGQSISGNCRRACDDFNALDGIGQPLSELLDIGGVMVIRIVSA